MSGVVPHKRPAPIDIQEQIAAARARAAEVKARLEAQRNGNTVPSTSTPTPPPPTSANGATTGMSPAEIARARVEAMKARVAAATAKASATTAIPLQRPPPPPSSASNPSVPDFDELSRQNAARGGLAVGIHPALLGDGLDRGKTNQRPKDRGKDAAKQNPYLVDAGGSSRSRRTLNFNHNMHSRPAMQAANELRRKAALEQMKKRIQAQTAKAGLEDSADIQVFAIPVPPDVEFWDEGLESGVDNNELITNLIVHPILIEPPQERLITLKPQALKMTKKEMAKARRIRRKEVLKDEQAKIRLGLKEAPAPKLTHKNAMQVYGEIAVKDPTAVEAMVNKQIAERQEKHVAENAARQLTKEERAEKIRRQAAENAAMGLTLCVFKVKYGKEKLHKKHRYLIEVNAKEYHDLTGLAITAPSMTLILIEAGEHSTRKYKKLLLDRIKWQAILEGDGDVNNADEEHDDSERICTLLHQGEIRDRRFKKWGGTREVETDTGAKDALTRAKMDNFWTLAKSSF